MGLIGTSSGGVALSVVVAIAVEYQVQSAEIESKFEREAESKRVVEAHSNHYMEAYCGVQ